MPLLPFIMESLKGNTRYGPCRILISLKYVSEELKIENVYFFYTHFIAGLGILLEAERERTRHNPTFNPTYFISTKYMCV